MTSIETNPMPGRAVSIRLRAAELVADAPALARRVDRVVLAFFLLIAFIAAIDPALAPRTLAHVAAELRGLAPWFAL